MNTALFIAWIVGAILMYGFARPRGAKRSGARSHIYPLAMSFLWPALAALVVLYWIWEAVKYCAVGAYDFLLAKDSPK